MPSLERFARVVDRALREMRDADSEAALMAKVVYPIISRGLNISGEDIDLERPLRGTSEGATTGRADCVVSMDGQPVLVVEAKAPHRRLLSARLLSETLTQAERYALALPVDYVLITNGTEWLLTKGRHERVIAHTPEQFLERLPAFYSWLNHENLWYTATGLILPTTFDSRDIIRRCWRLQISEADLTWLARLGDTYPFVPRLMEEVRKALAAREVHKFAREAAADDLTRVIHVDTSFGGYRDGAWRYDPLYRRYKNREAAFLRWCGRSARHGSLVRLFVVDDATLQRHKDHIYSTARSMLDDGWTVALMSPKDLTDFELHGGDVVGDYVATRYLEGEAFAHRFHRDSKRAAKLLVRVKDYMATKAELVFSAGDLGRARLGDVARGWVKRPRSRKTSSGA